MVRDHSLGLLGSSGREGDSGEVDKTSRSRKTKGRGFLSSHQPEDRGQEDNLDCGDRNSQANQGMYVAWVINYLGLFRKHLSSRHRMRFGQLRWSWRFLWFFLLIQIPSDRHNLSFSSCTCNRQLRLCRIYRWDLILPNNRKMH